MNNRLTIKHKVIKALQWIIENEEADLDNMLSNYADYIDHMGPQALDVESELEQEDILAHFFWHMEQKVNKEFDYRGLNDFLDSEKEVINQATLKTRNKRESKQLDASGVTSKTGKNFLKNWKPSKDTLIN